jgi:predicted negative regulator of RcsB-dependent stress response
MALALASGTMLGAYRLISPIRGGDGGQGQVWEAEDEAGIHYAIKVIRDARSGANPTLVSRKRWEREFSIGSAVRHDCLPAVVDHAETPAGRWIAFELIPGQSLAGRYSERRPADHHEFAAILICVCSALDALHTADLATVHGVMHRDVKPTNIIASGYGTETFAHLVDLGSAKPIDGRSTDAIGTLEYLSPEQVRGERKLTAKVDVWAAAAVGWWLLSGHPPFPKSADETREEYMARRLRTVHQAPEIDAIETPEWAHPFLQTIACALSPQAELRNSARQLASEIAAVAWPAGAPLELTPLLGSSDLYLAETIAVAPKESGRMMAPASLPAAIRPRAGLLALAARVAAAASEQVTWRALAALRDRAGRTTEADDAWARAARTGDPTALARVAGATEGRDGWEQAKPLWERAARGGDPLAAIRLAEDALGAGRRDDALSLLRRARASGHADAAYRLHRLLSDEPGDALEASGALEFAVQRGHVLALLDCAEKRHETGEISRAEHLWQLAADRGSHDACTCLAKLYNQRGDYKDALSCLDGLPNAEASRIRGEALRSLGRNDEARAEWESAWDAGSAATARDLAWACYTDRDWSGAERFYRRAVEGDRKLTAVLALTIDRQGRHEEAEQLLKAADPSIARSILLAAVLTEQGRTAEATEALNEAPDTSAGLPQSWAIVAAGEQLAKLTNSNRRAALWHAEALRLNGPPGVDAERQRSHLAYEHAAALGSRSAAEWAARYESDPARQRSRIEALVTEDATGWATDETARRMLSDGDRVAAIERFSRAARLGWIYAMTRQDLLDSVDDEEHEALLRRADLTGNAQAAYLLGSFLASRLGAAHPEVEAAHSRGDLRGDVDAAVHLGLSIYSQQGHTSASSEAWARAQHRGSGVGAFNLGVASESVGQFDRAEIQYRKAIELGEPDGHLGLAMLEHKRGHTARALESALEVDTSNPSLRTARVLGDLHRSLGENDAAIEAYERSDELEDQRSPIELAELYSLPADIAAALARASARIEDDTGPRWTTSSPRERDYLRRRVTLVRGRNRHVSKNESAAVEYGQVRPMPNSTRIGSHDPCWCGSGKKFALCHGVA